MSTIITPVQALDMMSKTHQYYIMEYHFEDKDNMYFRCFDSSDAIIQHIKANGDTHYEELDEELDSLYCEDSPVFIYNDFVYFLPTIDGVSKQVKEYFRTLK